MKKTRQFLTLVLLCAALLCACGAKPLKEGQCRIPLLCQHRDGEVQRLHPLQKVLLTLISHLR